MKKIFTIAIFLIVTLLRAQDSELNIGINGGITIGNLIKSQSSSALGGTINYLVYISENVKAGPMVGGIFFQPKTINGVKLNSKIYLPIGVSGRVQTLNNSVFLGLDAGYAIGISPTNDKGGIFFKPMIGYNISTDFRVNLFYSGVKKRKPTFGYIGLGISYNLFGGDSGYY